MSGPRALTDEQLAHVVLVTTERREAYRIARAFPTNADLAEECNCSERLIERISTGYRYKVSCGTVGLTDDEIDTLAQQLL